MTTALLDSLLEALEDFKVRHSRPMRLLFINTGGTITMVPNDKGLLEPVKKEEELLNILEEGMNLKIFTEKKLLDISINHLFTVDSSQMLDTQRDEIVKVIAKEYANMDGAIVIHGTDTGAETAKFLHLALPQYDPRSIWKREPQKGNWQKPVMLLSSQIPAVYRMDGLLKYRIDSDAPMNLTLALMIVADNRLKETGIITNNGEALRATASEKGAEVDIPPYRTDPGVPPVTKYTAVGLRYSNPEELPRAYPKSSEKPFVISESSQYRKAIIVFESSHLSALENYLGETGMVADALRPKLPEIVIYVSKGAGNVLESDYKIMKAAQKEGVVTFRVPLPGGRIPTQQVYDVPGHEIPALNMQPQTAKYKAMMTLYLADKVFKIPKNQRTDFIYSMMQNEWNHEFLPDR